MTATTIDEAMVRDIVQAIWQSVLGRDAEPDAGVPTDTPPPRGAGFRTGLVWLSGGWNGVVKLSLPDRLVREAAAAMFALPADAVDDDAAADALGELTNMAAGNLKPLVPGPTSLHLPVVVDGSDLSVRVPNARPVLRVPFRCDAYSFAVAVAEAAR